MSIFAFGNTFYLLSLNNTDKNRFINSYSEGLAYGFNLVLGEFDTDNFGENDIWLVWTIFIIASILLIVVLLNLLIAIIGDSYSDI